ncbi:zinc finger protein 25 [Orussus abietinus]|uniref:zinc finger protein 25 n=1 Tax=Orussus abietinus TaxID=222816 RepID=UPI0006257347|nr:zinc finger protein 25 [Orussus abietinus]XP_012275381.1 zinc finger protein 25 [Orussus abietinus]
MAPHDASYQKFGNICRLCLKQETVMSSLFEGKNNDDDKSILAEKITCIAPVEIKEDDGLPPTVCQSCRQLVNRFYDFRILVEISDQTLRSCLQEVAYDSKIKMEIFNENANIECTKFLTDSDLLDDDVDEFTVNAVLLPTESGIQVWKINDDDDDVQVTKDRDLFGANGDNLKTNSQEKSDSEVDDLGVHHLLSKESFNKDEFSGQFKESYSCAYCDNLFLESEVLSKHMDLHRDVESEVCDIRENTISCQLCCETLESMADLKHHISEHFDNEKEMDNKTDNIENEMEGCILREEVYENNTIESNILNNDLVIQALDKDNEGISAQQFVCLQCDVAYPTKKECITHAKEHLSSKQFKCKYCPKMFLKTSSRRYHEEGHTRDTKYVCVICTKCFAKKSDLKYHEGSHLDSPSVCTVCNKSFLNIQSFKIHMKRHILGSRYNCELCEKSYYTSSELARHIQKHSGKRAHPCDLCEMSFLSKPELNRHLKYHSGEKKFKCNVCFKSYFESGHLKVHERVHTGEKPFVCTVCNKAFITKSKLVRHVKIHVKDQIIMCDILPVQK